MSEQSEKHFEVYALRSVHKRMPLVQRNGIAIALVFPNTDEPEAFLLNTQTGYVIIYGKEESAQQRLQTLPTPFEFDVNSRTVHIPWPETADGTSRSFTFQLHKWRTNASSKW